MAFDQGPRIPFQQTETAMGDHLPTWFPQTDFGLEWVGSLAGGLADTYWAVWTDQSCRTVTVYYHHPGDGGRPTSWRVQYDKQKQCGNSVMGMGECIGYHVALSTDGSLSVQTIGLSRLEADRLVQSIAI